MSLMSKMIFLNIRTYFWKKKNDGILFFLKAFSWEPDLWETLGDFTPKTNKKKKKKKTQNWGEKFIFN